MNSEHANNVILEARSLECIRGDRRLFHDLSLQLDSGSLLHIQGENGSGKSTLQRTLCGLYQPVAGEVLWRGNPIRQQREAFNREVFYYGHKGGIKEELTALENLRIASRLDGKKLDEKAAEDALDKIGLRGFEDIPCKQLSQGQKRRVALARLYCSEASLWILDEPFSALDTSACDNLQTIISDHLGKGGITILTTHQPVALTQGHIQCIELGRGVQCHG